MKKSIKIVTSILMVVLLIATLSSTVMAVDVNGVLTNMESGAKDTDTSQITGIGGTIANVLTTVGIVVAVIVLLILGIKYMMGSASEKAEYKKTMIPYLVGALLILFASTIVMAVFNLLK